MIKNLSVEFNDLKSNCHIKRHDLLSCSFIEQKIRKLSNSTVKFEQILKIDTLPSFRENKENKLLVEQLKHEIETHQKEIKKAISAFADIIPHKIIKENLFNHLSMLLDQEIIKFKNILNDNIHKTTKFDILNNIFNESNNFQYMTYELEQEQILKNKDVLIEQTLFTITNTLMEIKMHLKSQSIAVDSLDRYFENTNVYLDRANEEITKIPQTMFGLKDKVIKFLFFLVFSLSLALLIKNASFNKINIDKVKQIFNKAHKPAVDLKWKRNKMIETSDENLTKDSSADE